MAAGAVENVALAAECDLVDGQEVRLGLPASGRWTKRRAGSARLRGVRTLTQADLDRAVTYVGVLPKVDGVLRGSFLAMVVRELVVVAAERGVALDDTLCDHVRRSLGRLAARRALQACHILTIEGRGYHQWLRGSTA